MPSCGIGGRGIHIVAYFLDRQLGQTFESFVWRQAQRAGQIHCMLYQVDVIAQERAFGLEAES